MRAKTENKKKETQKKRGKEKINTEREEAYIKIHRQ